MNRRTLLAAAPVLAAAPILMSPAPRRPAFAQQPAAATPLPLGNAAELGFSPERLARIRPVFQREVDANRLPGAVVMIARKGKLAYSESIGFRDRKNTVAMTPDSLFRLYSMTKPLTCVAALMLVEEGRINIGDPVSKYLPAFEKQSVAVRKDGADTYDTVAAGRPTLVYDLFRHTSGLAYGELTQNAPVKEAYTKGGLYRPGERDYDSRVPTADAFTAALAAAPLARQPGTTWEYSLSIDALGRVVEAASGQTLDAFLDQRVFRPLRMADAGFSLRDGQAPRLALHSGVDPANNQPVAMIDPAQPPGNASGGAGALASAGDYLRFAQMLANGGTLDGTRILSPSSVHLMASDQIAGVQAPVSPGQLLLGAPGPGYGFGLGVLVRTQDGNATVPGYAGQFMWAGWSGTYFWVDPAAEMVVVLMTAAPSVGRAANRRLMMQLAYAALED